MRCTSSESLVPRLEDATIGAPIEMLGTKWL
jgi:hypothetical protein